MTQPTAYEQYMLELINAERAKVGAQPLAFDGDLNEAADGHSQWMLDADVFSHTGSGGSNAGQRMTGAGYAFTGSWSWGENIAWATTRTPTGFQDEVQLLHTNLMNSTGHRANILNDGFREIGIGFEVGQYDAREGAFVTQDFARTGTSPFLTGVAFDDKDGDRFYDPGEGLGGITITATNTSTNQVYTATTGSAGGYDMALAAGAYTVSFSGPGIASTSRSVTIGTKNVKVDLVDPAMSGGDQAAPLPPAPSSAAPQSTTIVGTASANNTLSGTSGDDTINGLDGNDILYGLAGHDRLDGGTENDKLYGEAGNDLLIGRAGVDRLDGGVGNDSLVGDVGNDQLYGGAGNDRLYGGAGEDLQYGGTGADLFIFRAVSDLATAWELTDAIRDLRRAEGDRIHLASIDADITANGNQAFDFIGKAAFTDAGQVRFVNKNGETLILLNTDNDANHEAMIRVSGTQTPTDDWFVL